MGQKENKENEKTARETLGKYFYDMSKLIFTAVVLTNITALFGLSNFAWKSAALLIVGLISTYATAIIGNKILRK